MKHLFLATLSLAVLSAAFINRPAFADDPSAELARQNEIAYEQAIQQQNQQFFEQQQQAQQALQQQQAQEWLQEQAAQAQLQVEQAQALNQPSP